MGHFQGYLGCFNGLVCRRACFFALFLCAAQWITPHYAKAVIMFWTDFDNTLVETRKTFRGTFKTSFRLFRISLRNNTLQNIPQGPEYIDVSPQDFLRLVTPENKSLLAQGEGKPGAVGIKFTLEDGRVFEPANYMMVSPQTFQTFLAAPAERGEGFLVSDLKTSLKGTNPSIQGEAWPLMQLKLADAKTVNEFGIVSARGHEDKEWLEMFSHILNHDNESLRILNLPDVRNIHGVSRENYTVLTTSASITQRKVALFRQFLINLSRRGRLTDSDFTLNADGTEYQKTHTIIMAEDDQKTLDSLIEVYQSFAMRQPVPFKFVFWNTGFEDEVLARKRPKIGVIRSDGTFRAAQIIDLVGPVERLNEVQKAFLPQIEKILKKNESYSTCAEQLIAHAKNKK